MEKLNAAPAAKEIVQQVNGAPVAPPSLPAMPAGTPPGSKPPVASVPAKSTAPTSDKRKVLTDIFGK